ncbi:hypothetical protein J6590_061057 [Homalodisca vitripennis]|nr:hypothetical protein J6590_061057 [Homalodisca vitripennis]
MSEITRTPAGITSADDAIPWSVSTNMVRPDSVQVPEALCPGSLSGSRTARVDATKLYNRTAVTSISLCCHTTLGLYYTDTVSPPVVLLAIEAINQHLVTAVQNGQQSHQTFIDSNSIKTQTIVLRPNETPNRCNRRFLANGIVSTLPHTINERRIEGFESPAKLGLVTVVDSSSVESEAPPTTGVTS